MGQSVFRGLASAVFTINLVPSDICKTLHMHVAWNNLINSFAYKNIPPLVIEVWLCKPLKLYIIDKPDLTKDFQNGYKEAQ